MSFIGELFDEVVIDNLNDLADDISSNMRKRHYAHSGINDEEKIWAAQKFTHVWGSAYCGQIYNEAKRINEQSDYDNALDVRINDGEWNACYYVRSQMHGNEWVSKNIRIRGAKAWDYCYSLFEGDWGGEAAPLAAMLLTAALARAYQDYGFYVDVYTEEIYAGKDEQWVLSLSWDQDTPQEEVEDVAEEAY